MSEWREPKAFDLPGSLGRPVMLLVDYGAGEEVVHGNAYLMQPDHSVIFDDGDGWCTQYVKAWRPKTKEEWSRKK